MTDNDLRARLASIEDNMEAACKCSGRNISDVRLLAVSKFHSAAEILAAAEAGQYYFGENYVQEALEKRELIAQSPLAQRLHWDLTGHIQTRKAGLVAGAFDLIHTLDSQKLASALEKKLAEKDLRQDILIEVNIGQEAQKAGVMPEDLPGLAAWVKENAPHLNLRGLMCLPPVFDAGEGARPYFAALRGLRDKLENFLGQKLPELSMGMSGDYPVAIEEGATIVRIGTAIFGPRPIRN